MTKFLEQVADFILANAVDDLLQTAVILPNKRAEVFLKNHLRNKLNKTFWLPDFFTIDEFIVNNAGIIELEQVNLYFELYKIHKDIAGNEARSLDDFLTWAPVMLSDFNDIDLNLADAKTVFTHLSEVRAIESWNPGKPLTVLQKNYLAFYHSLYRYYTNLKTNLSSNGYGYKGMIYREMFHNIENISNNWKWNRFILVGFNALSVAEKKIFGFLHNNFKVDILFDIDEYYFSNDQFSHNEAGRLIKDLVRDWKIDVIKWKSNLLLTDQKQIDILGVPKRIGQVKYASQIIEEWSTEFVKNDKNAGTSNDTLVDTAIVLADENLLVPFLHSLPQIFDHRGEKIPFNITMGYPLRNSAIIELIAAWLSLLQSAENTNSGLLPVKNILVILNNAFFRNCSDYFSKNIAQKVIIELLKRNVSVVSNQQMLEAFGADNNNLAELINPLITKPNKPAEFIDLLVEFLVVSKPAVDDEVNNNPILREQFILIITQVKKIKILLEEVSAELSYRAIEKILLQIVNRSEINLKGEPLNGIQVMGMLETRTLDFRNLIILSANDGILPKTESIESFIPFDIRRTYNLPLPKDKTDVYAYHFFRLLQRAKKVCLIYNSQPDALGGGEKSRFILQLEDELKKANPLIKIINSNINIPIGGQKAKQDISIVKTPEILEAIKNRFKKGLSPTALTSFINCSLQYYFQYVASIKTPDILESTIEANVMGKVIHGVLEDLYKPFSNKIIKAEAIRLSDDQIKKLVLKKFAEEFKGGDLASGKNLLIVEVAIQYIKKYLEKERSNLRTNKRLLLSTEEELFTIMDFHGMEVKLRGIVDRTDKLDGDDIIRIVDYKTGRVEKKDLEIKDWDSLINDPDKSKAFQLLFYSYLHYQTHKLSQNIHAGIISMRNISSGFIKLILPDGDNLIDNLLKFQEAVFSLMSKIYDRNEPFSQTEDEKRCKFCDYKNICNRTDIDTY